MFLKTERYKICFQRLWDPFSPVIINTTYDNFHSLNQVEGKNPRCGTIDPKTLNKHDFCYHNSIDSTVCLFFSLRIRDKRDETYFHVKTGTTLETSYMKK